MIERITKNEERLDSITKSVKNLKDALEEFKAQKRNLSFIERYYGSNNWFKDKGAYESKKIPPIKAGVLSEDTVWDLLVSIDELMHEMTLVVKNYEK